MDIVRKILTELHESVQPEQPDAGSKPKSLNEIAKTLRKDSNKLSDREVNRIVRRSYKEQTKASKADKSSAPSPTTKQKRRSRMAWVVLAILLAFFIWLTYIVATMLRTSASSIDKIAHGMDKLTTSLEVALGQSDITLQGTSAQLEQTGEFLLKSQILLNNLQNSTVADFDIEDRARDVIDNQTSCAGETFYSRRLIMFHQARPSHESIHQKFTPYNGNPTSQLVLTDFSEKLNEPSRKTGAVFILGLSSSDGTDRENNVISKRRAEYIRDQLLQSLDDSDHITFYCKGIRGGTLYATDDSDQRQPLDFERSAWSAYAKFCADSEISSLDDDWKICEGAS